MSDILIKAALDYNQLKNTMYEIVLGRKGKVYTLMLHFPTEAFYHLAGLQHLTDIKFPSTNKERIFKDILLGKITLDMISKSIFFDKYHIKERICYLSLLPIMIENNSITYLINKNEYVKYTSIQADYLFEYTHKDNFIMYFFVIYEKVKPRFANEARGCSFFLKDKTDYTSGTAKAAVLQIKKIIKNNQSDFSEIILYQNSTYARNIASTK